MANGVRNNLIGNTLHCGCNTGCQRNVAFIRGTVNYFIYNACKLHDKVMLFKQLTKKNDTLLRHLQVKLHNRKNKFVLNQINTFSLLNIITLKLIINVANNIRHNYLC